MANTNGGVDVSGLPSWLLQPQPGSSGVGLVQSLANTVNGAVTPAPQVAPVVQAPVLPTATPDAGQAAPPWLMGIISQAMGGGGRAPGLPASALSTSGGQMSAESIAPERTSLKELASAVPAVTPRRAVGLDKVSDFKEFLTNPAAIAGLLSLSSALFNPESESTGGQIMGGLTAGLQGVGNYKTNLQNAEDARFKGDMDLQEGAANTLGKVAAAYKDANTMNFIPEHLVPGSMAIKQLQAQAAYIDAENKARMAGMGLLGDVLQYSGGVSQERIKALTEMYKANPEAFAGVDMNSFLNTTGGIPGADLGRVSGAVGLPLGMPPSGADKDLYKQYIAKAPSIQYLVQLEDNLRTKSGFATDPNILALINAKRNEFIQQPAIQKFNTDMDAALRYVINSGDAAAMAQYEALIANNNGLLDTQRQALYDRAKATLAKGKKKG